MKTLLAIPLVAMLAGCSTSEPNLPTQQAVDLNKYMGTWYEQARLPNRFQNDCVSDVQADYKFNPDRTIGVTNKCRKQDGSVEIAKGEGRLSKSVTPRNDAVLEVRFAPKWISWLPMVWGDYRIMRLEGDYEYSLVGTLDRQYLWVLARDKHADKKVVIQLIEYARSQGFDTAKMLMASD